jgi:hypothetical protein
MPRFRKRPVIISAEQWFPGKDVEGVEMHQPPAVGWLADGCGGGSVADQDPYPAVVTLEGLMRVSDGDWIITGVKGEKYPCKDEIFRATYEPAE